MVVSETEVCSSPMVLLAIELFICYRMIGSDRYDISIHGFMSLQNPSSS